MLPLAACTPFLSLSPSSCRLVVEGQLAKQRAPVEAPKPSVCCPIKYLFEAAVSLTFSFLSLFSLMMMMISLAVITIDNCQLRKTMDRRQGEKGCTTAAAHQHTNHRWAPFSLYCTSKMRPTSRPTFTCSPTSSPFSLVVFQLHNSVKALQLDLKTALDSVDWANRCLRRQRIRIIC